MKVNHKAVRERRWPLGFSHRAARTLDEMREVVATLRALHEEVDRCPDSMGLLALRNQVAAHLDCYGDEYVTRLLALVDNLRGYVQHAVGCLSGRDRARDCCDCGLDALIARWRGGSEQDECRARGEGGGGVSAHGEWYGGDLGGWYRQESGISAVVGYYKPDGWTLRLSELGKSRPILRKRLKAKARNDALEEADQVLEQVVNPGAAPQKSLRSGSTTMPGVLILVGEAARVTRGES